MCPPPGLESKEERRTTPTRYYLQPVSSIYSYDITHHPIIHTHSTPRQNLPASHARHPLCGLEFSRSSPVGESSGREGIESIFKSKKESGGNDALDELRPDTAVEPCPTFFFDYPLERLHHGILLFALLRHVHARFYSDFFSESALSPVNVSEKENIL